MIALIQHTSHAHHVSSEGLRRNVGSQIKLRVVLSLVTQGTHLVKIRLLQGFIPPKVSIKSRLLVLLGLTETLNRPQECSQSSWSIHGAHPIKLNPDSGHRSAIKLVENQGGNAFTGCSGDPA